MKGKKGFCFYIIRRKERALFMEPVFSRLKKKTWCRELLYLLTVFIPLLIEQ